MSVTDNQNSAVAGHPAMPMRDGRPYDLKYRTELAMRAIKNSKVPQPKNLPRPPGPSGRWLVFNAITKRESMAVGLAKLPRDYPRIAHAMLRGEHAYILTHPEPILEVFQVHGRDTTKSRGLQVARSVLGDGLLSSEGEHHLRQRRMVQPAFHKQRIAGYAEAMGDCARQHEKNWRDGDQIEVVSNMSALTLAIVGRALFGSDLTGDAKEVGTALTDVLQNLQRYLLPGSQYLTRVPSHRNRRLQANAARLDQLVQRLINEHRATGDTGDLLSMMIAAQEDGHTMDDAQLRDEAMTMVLAGHETTAMALSWTWFLLSANPPARTALCAELDSVLAGRDPGFGDIPRLPYTNAVIAESMRLYPPAWILGRRASVDLTIENWKIPRGSILLASAYATHRDPRFWDSALAYRPERWIDAAAKFDDYAPGQPKGAWFPFGFSNRKCIGDQFAWTEAVIVLATLAQRWDLELVPGQHVTADPAVTLRPASGIRMLLHER